MDIHAELYQLGTVLLAAVFGGLIGLEREFAGKAAGLRTHVFVSAGSALLVVLSNAMISNYSSNADITVSGDLSSDPIRIVQAIVIAISFLGAGTIVHERGKEIEGLTTAGSIYITAGVGIAVGVHEIVLAGGTVVLALVILWCIGRIEKRFGNQPPDSESTDRTAEASYQNLRRVSQ